MAAVVAAGAVRRGRAPPLLRGEPSAYLLTIDQLVSPDFTLDPPRTADGADIAAAATRRRRGCSAGWSAAAEEFFRAAASLADANGPLQVRDTVEEFASARGAAAVLQRRRRPRSTPLPVPRRLHRARSATPPTPPRAPPPPPTGRVVVEITVEWRVDNLLDVLVVRGRDGGTRLDDALLLAHRQTVTELGLATPRPRLGLPAVTP